MFWSLCSTCKVTAVNLYEFQCPAQCFLGEVELLFQEMKGKEGSIVPSSMFLSTGVCVSESVCACTLYLPLALLSFCLQTVWHLDHNLGLLELLSRERA